MGFKSSEACLEGGLEHGFSSQTVKGKEILFEGGDEGGPAGFVVEGFVNGTLCVWFKG